MKIFRILIVLTVGCFVSCSDQLDIKNPNEPSPEALRTEAGITNLASGIYANMNFPDQVYDFLWVSLTNHELMGDAVYCPFGNFGWRWANQVATITLDNGTVVKPPAEGDQALSLKLRNTRAETSNNTFAHEWITMYFVNNTANILLDVLKGDEVKFVGNAEMKKNTLRAWAYWWKGYAYSRIGSMYTAGLILDEPGKTNTNFVPNTEIMAEAEENFAAATAVLNGLAAGGDYTALLSKIIPEFVQSGTSGVPSPAEWIRNIQSMRARNLMVNKKDKVKTAQDWAAIGALAATGIQEKDFTFVVRQDGNNYLVDAIVPHRVLLGWAFASERLIQDFKPGDDRFTRNFEVASSAYINARGRGIQYGTRYDFIEGDYASTENGVANIYLGSSYEENELMRAEVLINTSQIDQGLAIIDAVRDFQDAGLAAVSGTGLTLDQAKEELRKERRIGLLLRGVPFYDARRWGVTDPVASGGGRKGAVVLSATGALNTNATFDYKYMDYFDVPQNELDFNTPGTGTAPVKENAK